MRFFIALEIPEENKQKLKLIQQKIAEFVPEARVLDNNKLHLTLAFIGEQPGDLRMSLAKVIADAALGQKPFEVTPSYIDGFPHLHNARVIWVGVKGDIDKLMIIRHKIKDGLTTLRQDVDERRFVPHIALAKGKNLKISKSQEDNLQKFMQSQFAPIRVDSLKLFESIPNHGLHQHNTLAEIKLV